MNKEIKADFEKNVYWSISQIESFHTESAYKVKDSNFPIGNSIALISKDPEVGFQCKIFLNKLYDYTYNQNIERFGVFESITLERSGSIYFIEKNSVHTVGIALSSPQFLTLSLTKFQSGMKEDFDKKKQRLIIPVEIEPNFDIIEFKSLKINETITFCGLVQILINGLNYHLFKYKNDDTGKKYLIIDSLEQNKFDEFKINCKSIITAYGYLSGNLYLNEYYYQTFHENKPEMVKNICYEKNEKSALTENPIFEPFRFREFAEAIGKKEQLKNIPSNMTISAFSKLCTTIKTNEAYSRCCELIIEGNQSKQILLRAGIYSIALETLTNIIYEENKEKINPISDKKLAKLIMAKFSQVVKEYDEFISDYGKKILESKINDINKPTNSKKLSMPFELYRINLSKDDLEVLNHRNKFLHGTSPFGEDELKEKEHEIKFIIAKLHYMINSLMLKYIGYSGHIINYPAWIQYNRKEKITDHLFRII
ncbi:MAG: hypothetical protein IPJ22_02320 [Bacteroidetes bacterium]|jgi:hypothetical protein|nr:hypothetical protein [Bacteroidota bacterium]MBP7256569.1 hypothetical protein [Chitinophagales bacterium]